MISYKKVSDKGTPTDNISKLIQTRKSHQKTNSEGLDIYLIGLPQLA